MLGEVLHDSLNQLERAAEAAGQDRLQAQVSEEAFEQVHPGSTVGSKMQLEARVMCQQTLYDRIFMGGVAAVKKFRPSNRAVKVVQR